MEAYYKQEMNAGQYKLFPAAAKPQEERYPEMWRCPHGGGVGTSPIILDSLVIFGSFDTHLYALDRKTGSVAWKFKTGDVILSAPFAAGGVIYFGSQDQHVYALDAKSGKLLWKYRTGGMNYTAAACYRNNIYFGSTNGYMHCFSPNGELLWKYKTGSAIYSTPSFANGRLYFGSYDKHFHCITTEGEPVWKYYVGEWTDNSPAIFAAGEEVWGFLGGRDYAGPASVCFGSYNRNFYVLDAENGRLQWMRRMDGIISWGHPAVGKGKIYVGDWSGHLYCLDSGTGSIDWKILTGGNVDCKPLLHGNHIYFGSEDGNVYALSLEGKVSWKYQTGGIMFCMPVVSDNVLYFGSMDTILYAFDMETKKVLWKFVTGGGVPAPIERILKFVEQIKESQRIFSAWKPEIIKPSYKDDKNLTFVAAPSEHAYAFQAPYRSGSPYETQQKKKKEPWER